MKTLATLDSEVQATVARVRADIATIRERAAEAGRAETAEERARIDELLREATTAKAQLDRRRSDDALSAALADLDTGVLPLRPASGSLPRFSHGRRIESLGTQFAQVYAQWRRENRSGLPKGAETTLLKDVSYETLFAATLTEDAASGGDLVVPDYRPGIIPGATRQLTIADLIAPGTTDSNLITYMVETAYTNAADTVAEAATKPESTLTFDAVSDPVRKIAHWLPCTEEVLDDVPQLRSYIDARLRLGVQLAEDDQLLNGTTTAPDIVGIRNRTGLATDVVRTDPETNADALARQISALTVATGIPPTGIVIHPTNWLTILLSKTDTGEYIGVGPFGRVVAPTLWNLPVAVSPVITAGTALVGAFRTAAQIFRKGGINVAITNSHQDYFIKNLVAIRAEERLALAVYRPGAFGEVTSLT